MLICGLGFISSSGFVFVENLKMIPPDVTSLISDYCGFVEFKLFYIFQNWVCFEALCALSLFLYNSFLCFIEKAVYNHIIKSNIYIAFVSFSATSVTL